MAVAVSTLIFLPLSSSSGPDRTAASIGVAHRSAQGTPDRDEPLRRSWALGRRTAMRTLEVALESGGKADSSSSERERVVTGAPSRTSLQGASQSRSERCRSARIAAVYFRFRTWTHQELRDGRLASKSPIVAGKSCHWAKFAAAEWEARARSARRSFYRWLNETRVPVGESELRAYINDDCLEEIIDRESAGTWSPTVRNYTDGRAYGLPQALPGYKMASAGSDWETNPKTQIAWMRGYVNGRYGGSCAALAHHNANGWY